MAISLIAAAAIGACASCALIALPSARTSAGLSTRSFGSPRIVSTPRVGDGPARAQLSRRYPQAVFLGSRQGEALAQAYAAADVFVFPSRTDTFGLVLLEALASGLPVAAFPVTGPRDVIGDAPVGVLDDDLRMACLAALTISPQDCVEFAAGHSWEASARAFVEHAENARSVDFEGERIEFAAEGPPFAA